jgi:hypothetical protein
MSVRMLQVGNYSRNFDEHSTLWVYTISGLGHHFLVLTTALVELVDFLIVQKFVKYVCMYVCMYVCTYVRTYVRTYV